MTGAAYRAFLAEHVGSSPLEYGSARLRLEDELLATERAADRRHENAKHAPTATDRLRAEARAEALETEAIAIRNRLGEMSAYAQASCCKCGSLIPVAQAYEAGGRCTACFTPSRQPKQGV